MILQIQCGGTGLNLQAASQVYITSPNWNPFLESQAICRAHRKKQTRAVVCTRFVMKDTIDEHCIKIQRHKMSLVKEFLNDETTASRLGDMNQRHIAYMLGGARKQWEREQADAAKAVPVQRQQRAQFERAQAIVQRALQT